MRTGRVAARERVVERFERNAIAAITAGLCRVRVEDDVHNGSHVVIEGHQVVNMGSCAYLGLNIDERLKEGAKDAIDRFGPVFSSSTAYTSVSLYTDLELRLREMMDCRVLVPTTTTLGHLAFLQVAPQHGDHLIFDAQAHASLHLAAHLPRAEGMAITIVPHNDLLELEAAIADAHQRGSGRIWYIADGVYSMYGDTIPINGLRSLLETHPMLHAYIDDAHGFGWSGTRGSGVVREAMGAHPRLIVAASLSKSFGSGGAAIAIPDEDLADRVQMAAGTMTFSGPLHPAELGAAVVAADIHLSDELAERQARLESQIRLMSNLLREAEIPIAHYANTPIWFVRVGPARMAFELGRRLLDLGFYTNAAAFPAVPTGMAGLRFTQTLYHTDSQLEAFVEALASELRAVQAGGDVIDLRAEPG